VHGDSGLFANLLVFREDLKIIPNRYLYICKSALKTSEMRIVLFLETTEIKGFGGKIIKKYISVHCFCLFRIIQNKRRVFGRV